MKSLERACSCLFETFRLFQVLLLTFSGHFGKFRSVGSLSYEVCSIVDCT